MAIMCRFGWPSDTPAFFSTLKNVLFESEVLRERPHQVPGQFEASDLGL